MSRDPEKTYFIYILSNRKNGTLYIGFTRDLARRIEAHKNGLVPGFSREYGLRDLVYAESHDSYEQALAQEKRLKRWRRAWKVELIERDNPGWQDLSNSVQ